MPKKSNSKQQQNNQDTDKISEELPDESDFWNMESDPAEIQVSSEELEEIDKILSNEKREEPLKPLSEKEVDIEVPDEKEIINSLEQHEDNQEAAIIPDLSEDNLDELTDPDDNSQILVNPKPIVIDKKPVDPKSALEKIATLICYLLILGVFTYLIYYTSNQHDFNTVKSYESNVPSDGEYANIEKIETWWEEPSSNNTKFGIVLVPSATITLGPNSKSGVIRSVFYSDEEGLQGKFRPKGDPFTNEFKDGKFLETGTNQVTIYGTDGFKEMAHFMFYKSQDETRWTIDVKEAPSAQTDLTGFNSLALAPIEASRK